MRLTQETVTRRELLAVAAAVGAIMAWASASPMPALPGARENRDLYPEGVASGDPDSHSVMLWTRRPCADRGAAYLRVEVALDPDFSQVLVRSRVRISAAADWTCRVLVGNIKPSRVYWYRFIDADGQASRVGRTVTAPARDDARPVRFAFVSCQNTNYGAQNAYRRMIFEDERASAEARLQFVLHLGDFVYETVYYPEDRPQGMYDRPIRDIVRYPQGEKITDFHVPATVDDYRALYRAYLHDADIQDARARWPFVCIWDNHEFSWYGWQSMQIFGSQNRPAQTRKVAANQAWFEYQPARVLKSGGAGLEEFHAPRVQDVPVARFDSDGFGDEPNNRAAVASLQGYRALQWGPHVELLITDQRSYRSEEPSGRPQVAALLSEEFPGLLPQEVLEVLDAGRAQGGGHPPATLKVGEREIPNFRRDEPPQTLLGAVQKSWFLGRLRASTATWKVWCNTLGTLDYRVDPGNLPAGLGKPWPGEGFAGNRGGDASTAYLERGEIYAAVRDQHITGFVTVAGDRHSFWAGLAAPSLPPREFEPVGVAFVTGSISAPGTFEKLEHDLPKTHPLRSLYLVDRPGSSTPAPSVNMLYKHGVRSCLEYARTGDLQNARRLSNPQLSPHLSFLDLGGHGYSIVLASAEAFECEFVAISRPVDRVTDADGGPVLYRIMHRARRWSAGERPRLEQHLIEGNPELSL